MIYTTRERNNAVLSVGNGDADLSNIELYERLASFNWVAIEKLNGIISNVKLTYAGQNLLNRLKKQAS